MKHLNSLFFILLATGLLAASLVRGQVRPSVVLYDENNRPTRIANEIIVRFEPDKIIHMNVDDISKNNGALKEYLIDTALEAVSNKVGFDMANIMVYKIFFRNDYSRYDFY